VFGKRTADEILSTAKLAYSDFFDHLISFYFDQQLTQGLQLNSVPDGFCEIYFCIGVVDYRLRRKIEAAATQHGMIPFTIVHPSSVVDAAAKIGGGLFSRSFGDCFGRRNHR